MSRTYTSKSIYLVIEYLQDHSVPVKLTILYSEEDSIILVLEFAEGPYWNTKWKFQTEEFGLPDMIYKDLMELINRSDAVELSTVFVTPGSISAKNWKISLRDAVQYLNTDNNLIKELPEKPKFDIVFGLNRKKRRHALTVVFQPTASETPTRPDASQRQNTYLQEQLEQNRNEIAALREQLRSQGGVDLQRQVNNMEIVMEKKLKEMSDSTSKELKEVSQKHDQHVKDNKKQLAQLKADHQEQMQQREREHQAQIQKLQSQIPVKEKVVTLTEPKILGRGPGTFTLDAGVVPQNAKKVSLLLFIQKGGGGSDRRFYAKAHTSIGSQKHYHHSFGHQYSNSAWVFDNVEWEFPIGPNHRQVIFETDMILHGNHSVELYVVGYTV